MSYSVLSEKLSPKWYAQQLLHKLSIEKIPINALEIVNMLGIRYREENLEDDSVDGVLIRKGDKALIVVNSELNYEPRKNFTIAHEIGHFVIEHHNSEKYSCSSIDMKLFGSSEKIIEAEANRFAAELLMPEKYILQDLKYRDFTYETIEYISNKYKVSKEAAALRIVEYSSEKCAIVISRDGKILWSRTSNSFKYKLRNKLHEHTYAIDAFSCTDPLPNKFEKVYPHSWLIDLNIPDNLNVQEHSIFYHDFNVVFTLIKILPNEDDEEIFDDY